MKKYYPLGIIVPLVMTILALWKTDYVFHVGVPLSCIAMLIITPAKEIKSISWIVIISLIFCIAGDWMLRTQATDPNRFIYGILLFLIAHIGYLIFCLKQGSISKLALTVLLLGYGFFFIFYLYPSIGNSFLLIPVFLYLIFSCLTLAAAIGLNLDPLSRWLFVSGIVCFLFSDTLIALNVFLGKSDLYILMMPMYYMSHVLVTAGMIDKRDISSFS